MDRPETPPDTPTTLWLTDRSRYTTGTGRCARQRYLNYHFGPTGYGIVKKAESLPLMTGQYCHKALEGLFNILKATDTFPTVPEIRSAIRDACQAYEERIAARGFRGLLQSEKSDQIVIEQQSLLTGLVWAACQTVLPWLHQNYRVLEAETETLYPLSDSISVMLRQDVIAEHRVRKSLAYFESKTTGWLGESWAPQWETKPQLSIGTFGVKERFGRDIEETYIIGLYKGRRVTVGEGESQTQRQDSPLCSGYCRPANPPLTTDDWVPSYEWTSDEGEMKRKSRAHEKRAVTELAQSDWEPWISAKSADPSLTPAEFWAAWLPKSVLNKQVFLVGPMRRQEAQIQMLKGQILGEEERWGDTLWKLYEAQQTHAWASPVFQAILDREVPASWNCRPFGVRHQCEFVDVCFRQPGWDDPMGTGKFVARRPHHQPELDAAIERGLLPEQADEGEEQED